MAFPTSHPLASKLQQNVSLARFTSARIGGTAEWYLQVESATELAEAVHFARNLGWHYRILGAGSNLLVSDSGIAGLTIHNRAKTVHIEPGAQHALVFAESGVYLPALARQCALQGIAGLAWAATVPGTLGGAIFGNAGAHGGDMAQCLRSVQVFTQENTVGELALADLHMGYRTSRFKQNPPEFVILSAQMLLPFGSAEQIQVEISHFQEYRKRTQPPGATMGSMFKNPPGDYAGRLIEAAGLKGYRVGDAEISPVHANFFVNHGGAKTSDIQTLINQARQTVFEKFGVQLELEIEIWQEIKPENCI
ncbi:MAG TPA: UDP-N-acetylmuramate dehydrogenase [Anaerolineales bacterium]|nr:UDP-N-acetylmuramate dehydrogenase [Anaerolineales bacterium]